MQRNVQTKLEIKSDQVIPVPGSGKSKTTIGTCPSQCSDGKASRGPDLKRMKKSRPIKRSNVDSLRSVPFSTDVPQPGKPPPLSARVPNSAAATPQKQPQVRQGMSLPNYMKPTSSSDARKGSSVSPSSIQISSATKRTVIMGAAILKKGSSSSSKSKEPAKNLTRSSSLRFVRTLMKTPSFKPAKSSPAKRCSKVAPCTNMNAHKATCSSTLKDSKFPKYLTLSPSATEAEGTSLMKVCPYTYCSLNGHCHSPLLPLKCFISARRRAIKPPRNIEVEALKTDIKEPTPINRPKSMKAEDAMDYIKIYAESYPEENESEIHKKINLPISVPKEALSVESFQGKEFSEVEGRELGSQSLDMEWDGHHYSISEINEALVQPEKSEACSDFLCIEWKCITDEEMQQEENRACETQLPEEQISEISELSQLSHCFTYDQYSSLEEDEMEEVTTDAEELAETLTVGLTAESAERIKTDPILHEPREDQDSAISGFSCNQELEFSSQSQHLCEEKENTAADEFNENDDIADDISQTETQDLLSDEQQSHISDVNKGQTLDEVDKDEILIASEDSAGEVNQKEAGICTQSSIAEDAPLEKNDSTSKKLKGKYTHAEINSKQYLDPHENWIGKNRCKRLKEEEDNPRRFNPRDPNYLPIVPDKEAEKVDLRHQMMDERRNSEEWMIDYALRQAVTRLEPARKRKVALLVEAFEKVMPVPKVMSISKWETHLTSPRPIQACS